MSSRNCIDSTESIHLAADVFRKEDGASLLNECGRLGARTGARRLTPSKRHAAELDDSDQ